MNIRDWQSAFFVGVIVCSTGLSGCQSREHRARQAFDRYQAAGAIGDLAAARNALLALVTADDKVASYWVELGKTQVQLGDFGGAYNAFQRAHELDRANPSILGFMTQIALRSGNLPLAEQTARDLALVAPDDPAVPLTYGYVALRQGDLDAATRQAKVLLAASPYDPSANVFRARVLLRSGDPDKAISLLRQQVRQQPSDHLSLRALLSIYELREQWTDAAEVAQILSAGEAKDQAIRARLIEAEIRSGRMGAALQSTRIGLEAAGPRELDLLLAPWIATGKLSFVSAAVFEVASRARGERRTAMARFLVFADRPQEASLLTRELATLPVTAGNIAANALYGATLAATGQASAGLDRLNAVLRLDAANADALRGRAILRSRTGAYKLALEDAQKLIAADRSSPQARILLAKIYLAARRMDDARRTMWEAFHDIPAERSIYDYLKALVMKSDGPEAGKLVDDEFKDQGNDKMTRSFA